MHDYLFIESRDPFTNATLSADHSLLRSLAEAGSQVALYLAQNGVFGARDGTPVDVLAPLAGASIPLYADDFSLRERAIPVDALKADVQIRTIDTVVDALEDGRRIIWL